MRFFETHIEILAPAERIWSILTDASRLGPAYGLTRLQGNIALGQTLRLQSEVAPGREFVLKVEAFDPPRRMIWTGGMPLGLFRGRRSYVLSQVPGGCDFHMREEYTGLLAPMMFRVLPDLTQSFRKFAAALKKDAEHD